MKVCRLLSSALVLGSLLTFTWSIRADDVVTLSENVAPPELSKAPPLPAVFSKAQPESVEDLKAIEKQVREVLARVLPCTVCIRAGAASGSGVLISADGLILTAGHVSGEPGRTISIVMPDGKSYPGKTLGGNGTMDSGLVRITKEGKWPFAEMGSSGEMKRNDWCIVTGHPGGFKPGRSPVVRVGRIVDINTRTDSQYIRTDCTIVGGDSGGPLFDMNGRVIGIHSRIGDALTANLHVPVDTYRETWARLVKGDRWGSGIGRPIRPTPSVAGEPDYRFKLDPDNKACTVNEIWHDSPAYKAGLRALDVIKSMNGKAATSVAALQDEFKKRRPGDEITLEVQRGDELVKIKFVVGKKETL
jgi:serine protease Do